MVSTMRRATGRIVSKDSRIVSNAPRDGECIFCRIVAGEIPSAKVFETEEVIAFLDIAPVRPGHALVLPKGHYPTLWHLPDELGAHLLAALKAVGRAVMEATGAEGLNVGMNNHPAAGQLVPHAHVHLIPRQEGDGLSLWDQSPYEDTSAMQRLADSIRTILS